MLATHTTNTLFSVLRIVYVSHCLWRTRCLDARLARFYVIAYVYKNTKPRNLFSESCTLQLWPSAVKGNNNNSTGETSSGCC